MPPNTVFSRPLEVVRAELLALDEKALLPLNVDVVGAALIVLGVARPIRAYRRQLVSLVGEEHAAGVDRLELLAAAVLEANAHHQVAEAGADAQRLSKELAAIRATLFAEVRALIARGATDKGAIHALRRRHGFHNQALDVLQLVAILKPQPALHAVDREQLEHAELVAFAVSRAAGARSRIARTPTAIVLRRAFTLMATTYDRVRRAVSFLRWDEGDADLIAPSLFRGRGGRARALEEGG